jgi:hypothetical protein
MSDRAARKSPASRAEQDTYYWLRSNLTAALAEELPKILAANVSPMTRDAATNLTRFKAYHPTTEFRIFRPEDANSTDNAGDAKLFLR